MVEVTYHCPYCGAVTGVEREGYLNDKCVSREPLDGWEYASTTDDLADRKAADGIEFVCLGDAGEDVSGERLGAGGANDPAPDKDGCGRTFYLSFVKYDEGEEVSHRQPDIDRPRFDFRP